MRYAYILREDPRANHQVMTLINADIDIDAELGLSTPDYQQGSIVISEDANLAFWFEHLVGLHG